MKINIMEKMKLILSKSLIMASVTMKTNFVKRVADIDFELESKELEIGECQIEIERCHMEIEQYQIEIEELKEVVSKYQEENALLKEKNRSLTNENAVLKAVLSTSHLQSYSNNKAIISLRKSHSVLQSKLEKSTFGANFVLNNDEKANFYTGIPYYQLFLTLFLQLQPLFNTTITKLSLFDEFFLTLVKLRLGVTHKDLAYRMDIKESSVGCIFRRWIDVMSTELKHLVSWPDKEQLQLKMPKVFRKHYSNVRCIIDCFEVFLQRPTSFVARAQTYSNYKKHNTIKVLIGVAPTGAICFISEAWGGRVSDKVITQQSGFLKKVEYGDDIMADRGFNVGEDIAVSGGRLLIPAFTRGKAQLSQGS